MSLLASIGARCNRILRIGHLIVVWRGAADKDIGMCCLDRYTA
jgi:hypothetical protein